jgi:hypothetical protein
MRIGQLFAQGLLPPTFLPQLPADLPQMVLNLVRVIPSQDSPELGLRGFLAENAELSIYIRLHVARQSTAAAVFRGCHPSCGLARKQATSEP